MTMILFCVIIMAAAIWNIVVIVRYLVRLSRWCPLLRRGTLYGTAIDNELDYISYFVILCCVGIALVFWTYKPSAVNYCTFCCFGYKNKKYFRRKDLPGGDMKLTLCYAFCPLLLDNAEQVK